MSTSVRFLAAVAAIALLGTAPAVAAVVTPGSGPVSVNSGSGYKPITGSVEAQPGDSVMVGPGGSATITYPNGCIFSVKVDGVYVVQETPTCEAAAIDNQLLIGAGVVAVGAGVAILASQGGDNDKPASP
jgi:hypothetical protein